VKAFKQSVVIAAYVAAVVLEAAWRTLREALADPS
jgi:hypothetical protein